MWINENSKNRVKNATDVVCGRVTAAFEEKVNISADRQCIGSYVIAPCGVAYVPTSGSKTAIIPLDGTQVCIGGIVPSKNLQPGEIMLYSAGGATLVMKNNG